MWKARSKSKVSRLKASLRSLRGSRRKGLDARQVAQIVAALATASALTQASDKAKGTGKRR